MLTTVVVAFSLFALRVNGQACGAACDPCVLNVAPSVEGVCDEFDTCIERSQSSCAPGDACASSPCPAGTQCGVDPTTAEAICHGCTPCDTCANGLFTDDCRCSPTHSCPPPNGCQRCGDTCTMTAGGTTTSGMCDTQMVCNDPAQVQCVTDAPTAAACIECQPCSISGNPNGGICNAHQQCEAGYTCAPAQGCQACGDPCTVAGSTTQGMCDAQMVCAHDPSQVNCATNAPTGGPQCLECEPCTFGTAGGSGFCNAAGECDPNYTCNTAPPPCVECDPCHVPSSNEAGTCNSVGQCDVNFQCAPGCQQCGDACTAEVGGTITQGKCDANLVCGDPAQVDCGSSPAPTGAACFECDICDLPGTAGGRGVCTPQGHCDATWTCPTESPSPAHACPHCDTCYLDSNTAGVCNAAGECSQTYQCPAHTDAPSPANPPTCHRCDECVIPGTATGVGRCNDNGECSTSFQCPTQTDAPSPANPPTCHRCDECVVPGTTNGVGRCNDNGECSTSFQCPAQTDAPSPADPPTCHRCDECVVPGTANAVGRCNDNGECSTSFQCTSEAPSPAHACPHCNTCYLGSNTAGVCNAAGECSQTYQCSGTGTDAPTGDNVHHCVGDCGAACQSSAGTTGHCNSQQVCVSDPSTDLGCTTTNTHAPTASSSPAPSQGVTDAPSAEPAACPCGDTCITAHVAGTVAGGTGWCQTDGTCGSAQISATDCQGTTATDTPTSTPTVATDNTCSFNVLRSKFMKVLGGCAMQQDCTDFDTCVESVCDAYAASNECATLVDDIIECLKEFADDSWDQMTENIDGCTVIASGAERFAPATALLAAAAIFAL